MSERVDHPPRVREAIDELMRKKDATDNRTSEYIVRMPSDMPYEIKAELNAWYVNSEPLVRCRDCTGFYETWDGYECERFSGEYHRAEPDGFCAWGERREP